MTDHDVTDHEVTEQDFADDATELPLEILDDDELRGALEAMLLIVDAPAPIRSARRRARRHHRAGAAHAA